MDSSMLVWAQRGYGDASVLVREQRPVPRPAAGAVVVRVRVASVNAGDVHLVAGDPLVVRAAMGLRRPRQGLRGMDVAGEVVEVGPAVTGIARGARVVAEVPGCGFGPFVVVDRRRLVLLSDEFPLEPFAALPVAAGTAMLALDRTGATAGERVLVLGASGGVGHFAVQQAAALGAEVTAVAREQTHDLVQQWGAASVLSRGADPGSGYDVVVDVAGDRPLLAVRGMLAPNGRAALVAGTGSRVLGPIGRIARAVLLTRRRARLMPIAATPDVARLARNVDAVVAGGLRPHVSAVYDAADAPAALAHVASGAAVGKVLVRI